SVRAGALFAGGAVRLDLSPACLQHHSRMQALERMLLHTTQHRLAITYDELAEAPFQAENTEASNAPAPGFAA
ncbi:MAG TPA: hypothetical protein VNY52_06160, partial [Solirubrobacteraceae bacterium]|nr:hypothetical protein [Solirubrobacteraceae bacterium]